MLRFLLSQLYSLHANLMQGSHSSTFDVYMYSLQIHKQQIVLTTVPGESKCTHFRMWSSLSRLDYFQIRNLPPMPAINGGPRLSCCCAGRRRCRRGGALCWECPSAAGRASARRWTGWSASEQRPGDRAGGGKRAPHTLCRCGGRASPTLVRHLCHILLSARMLPHANAQQITRT